MNKNRLMLIVGVTALAVVVAVGVVVMKGMQKAPSSFEEALDLYVSAVQESDSRALARLAHRDVDASEEIDALLAEYGGTSLVVDEASVEEVGMGMDVLVTVRGSGNDGSFTQRLQFTGDEFGVWYLNFPS